MNIGHLLKAVAKAIGPAVKVAAVAGVVAIVTHQDVKAAVLKSVLGNKGT